MFVAGRLLRTLLFGVQPFDPLALTISVAVLAAIGFVAAILPARRAAACSAIEAMRGT
jgi:ABC-type antimicrobial peptide transport system permease subunit